MIFFNIPFLNKNLLDKNTLNYLTNIGDNIVDPPWTIRPFKFDNDHLLMIKPITNRLPVQPMYVALIMTPANSICKTHVDNIGGRITAINIPLQIDNDKSFFEYMSDLESDVVVERLTLDYTKCWSVDIPHRVDNSHYDKNRVVLSLSFKETVKEMYDLFQDTNL